MLDCAFKLRIGTTIIEPAFHSPGGITVLFGPSGAGKSVTLRAIAGLVSPESGLIRADKAVFYDSARGINLPPQDRDIGYVPQSLGLYSHMTADENVAFALPKMRRADRETRVRDVMERLQIADLRGRKPATLSGGQQQRVALARALARGSRLLLLDEPFSALDEALRSNLRLELPRLRDEFGTSVVFVTHDLREAHLLADRLVVLDDGRVLQCDAREEVFRRPTQRRVAELTGTANIFEARAVGMRDGYAVISVDGIELLAALPAGGGPKPGEAVDVCIRSELVNIRRVDVSATDEPNLLRARIIDEFAYGSTHTLHLAPVEAGPRLDIEIAARPYEVLGIREQREWTVELPPSDLHVMPRGGPE